MFDPIHLQKTKARYQKALLRSLQGIVGELPEPLRDKTLVTIQNYESKSSLAGLTHVFHFLSEYLYAGEILEFLYENRSSFTPLSATEFQESVQAQWEESFSSEDYHLEVWKSLPSSFTAFRTFLFQWQNQSKKEFLKTNSLLFPKELKDSLAQSFQNPKDPRKQGWKSTKFQKLPLSSSKKQSVLQAEHALENIWKEGYELYKTLTIRVIPLSSPGLVSYSHNHQMGISYIHFQKRDFVDHLDDLIHENSHHHLNLLLATEKLWKKNLSAQIFFSPWRRALRPFRALVHSVFTFTYGAKLMEEILKTPLSNLRNLGFTTKDWDKVRYRLEEEVISNSYSLADLSLSKLKSNWTEKGRELLIFLQKENNRQKRLLKKLPPIQSKTYQKKIKDLKIELELARNHYLIR